MFQYRFDLEPIELTIFWWWLATLMIEPVAIALSAQLSRFGWSTAMLLAVCPIPLSTAFGALIFLAILMLAPMSPAPEVVGDLASYGLLFGGALPAVSMLFSPADQPVVESHPSLGRSIRSMLSLLSWTRFVLLLRLAQAVGLVDPLRESPLGNHSSRSTVHQESNGHHDLYS